ncbi:succinate dehydrogenase assembly factor 3, mitochondrial [Bacillus rossius redtenbacheri]|uniref:succinate dehydrogenase assembly factor 3, mitochondrial n=1 Tax=Bacillus rossius redtenbacheri TaxID=93214 RepID=UPI002FDE9DF9
MEPVHLQRVRLLYKTILRLHRGLPEELRKIGDGYARDEFKRHKQCNTAETAVFMSEWTRYVILLAQQLGVRGPATGARLGQNLEDALLDDMRDDQVQQLYDLLVAATGGQKVPSDP